MAASTREKLVTLKNDKLHRGITTITIPDTDSGKDDAGNYKKSIAVPFMKGKAKVDEQTARRLKDAGYIG